MAGRLRRLRDVARCIPRGSFQVQCCRSFKSSASAANLLNCILEKSSGKGGVKDINRVSFRRFTSATELAEVPPMEVDLLNFIKSSIDDIEGPNHCWLNKSEGSGDAFKKDGIFLVISGVFHQDSSARCRDDVIMIENVKKLQQRYPLLNVIGFQSCIFMKSDAFLSSLAQLFVEEYVSFPVIYAHSVFPQVAEEQCYFLFKEFSSPINYLEKGVDLEVLDKAIRDLDVKKEDPHGDSKDTVQKQNLLKEPSYQDVYAKEEDSHSLLKGTAQKQNVVKEPYISSLMRNLLLYFPGCISTDDCGNRIFVSDSNHHRIIIVDDKGMIQDCIGSSPGFEDGDFVSAKLFRPAASYYDEDKECLYFVDSENHAIRRADLEKRVIETICPSSNNNKNDGLWSWIRNKAGLPEDNDANDEDSDPSLLMFPWHLMRSVEDEFFVLNRSFESLWIMDSSSWEIKDIIRGPQKISEICGQMIMDKVSPLKQFPCEWLQRRANSASSLEKIAYSNLLSSFATIEDGVIFCDTVAQQVMKYNRESGFTNLQFTNFGILGLPYWLAYTLEKVYTIGDVRQWEEVDDVQSFTLLPGEVQIQIIIDIPSGTELVEPIHEGCIWRQARGAAVEISRSDQKEISLEKVGVAQQWYDELDSITLLPDSDEEVEEDVEEAKIASISTLRDDQVCINCTVNTSPGTSEVIIYAALYLKLKKDSKSNTVLSKEDAERIADILNSKKSTDTTRNFSFRSKSTSNKVPSDLIFMKPLNIRIKLFNLDHPKAADGRSTILTDSFVKVNVSLNS